jgi:hypothetical protein
MKSVTLVVCSVMFLVGCGSAGSGSTGNNVTMQAGQWEYVVVPDNSAIPMYIDVNQPGTKSALSASQAVIFNSSQVNLPGATAPLYCGGFNLDGTITDSTLKGSLSWGQPSAHFANFSGELAANGQSMSKGKYSGQLCSNTRVGPTVNGPEVDGTFSGYTVSAVNGTFTGTLNGNLYGANVVTLSITQNPDFSLNVAGTSTENGVTSAFTPSATPGPNSVNGGTVYINGSSKNINGSQPFSLTGHLNPNATQMTISYMTLGDENMTGALTKQ